MRPAASWTPERVSELGDISDAAGSAFSTHERISEAPLCVEPVVVNVEGMSFKQIGTELQIARRDAPLTLVGHGRKYTFIREQQAVAADAFFFAQTILLDKIKSNASVPIKK